MLAVKLTGSRAAGKVPDVKSSAFVVSVEHDVAAPDRSAHDGCEACGTPAVEMPSSH